MPVMPRAAMKPRASVNAAMARRRCCFSTSLNARVGRCGVLVSPNFHVRETGAWHRRAVKRLRSEGSLRCPCADEYDGFEDDFVDCERVIVQNIGARVPIAHDEPRSGFSLKPRVIGFMVSWGAINGFIMSMPRKAMQELGFQACCLRCDAPMYLVWLDVRPASNIIET